MKEKFFSWFEAKEEEPAIEIVLVVNDEEKETKQNIRLDRVKVLLVILPLIVLAAVIFMSYFTFAVTALGIISLTSLIYMGIMKFLDTIASIKHSPGLRKEEPEIPPVNENE